MKDYRFLAGEFVDERWEGVVECGGGDVDGRADVAADMICGLESESVPSSIGR